MVPRPTPPPRPAARQAESSSSVTASSSALEVPENLTARAAKSEPTTPGTLETEPCEPVGTEDEVAVETEEEEGLSEVQLRELYDDEEIERFLRLFSAVSGLLLLFSSVQVLTERDVRVVCSRG